jgi:hypothetical protein
MSEWWTYGLSDFLMFSPQAYWSLVARYNGAWWPAQGLAVAVGIAVLVLVRGRQPFARTAVLPLLAAGWAWVGWAFYWQHYSEIFLAAPHVAAACAGQSLLLFIAALLPAAGAKEPPPSVRGAGVVLVGAALLYPLLAGLAGRGWGAAEVIGFMPDPTALATFGALLGLRDLPTWQRIVLAVLPSLLLLLGGATRWLLA